MPPEEPPARRRRLGLALLLTTAGTMHFVTPQFFDDIVPSWMPGTDRTVTYASGVAELACAALLANRRTARVGGWAALALLVGVYPANLQMVVDAGRPSSGEDWAVWFRAPLQIPLLLWAHRVARDAQSSSLKAAMNAS